MARLPVVTIVVIFILAMSCAASQAASDGGTDAGSCTYPLTDTFTINGTGVSNYATDAIGQTCDPFVSAQYSSLLGTRVWGFSGWTDSDTQGNGLWHQQVLLTIPAQVAGTYDASSGATAEYALDGTISCQSNSVTITVSSYGDVGGLIIGTYSANLTDTQSSGRCPTTIAGSFTVTRAQ